MGAQRRDRRHARRRSREHSSDAGRDVPAALGTPDERYEVRIAAKKARYPTKFLQSPYPARHVKRYVSCLAALQDALGLLNEAALAHQFLGEIGADRLEAAWDASFARGYLCAATKHDIPGLGKVIRKRGTALGAPEVMIVQGGSKCPARWE
jgi:CHAD domain-containing protein